MRRLWDLLARAFVRLRLVVLLGCIAGAAWTGFSLPSISGAGGGALGELAPKNAPALRAERISATEFAFPLLSRTIVVARDPRGLPARRQAGLVRLAARLTRGRLPGFRDIPGALPLLNGVGDAPFSRDHGTTALVALAIALHFRAPLAALLTVGAVALAYLVTDHLVGWVGRRTGISVPAEVQPVLVVRVFGVVTDYSVFFLSQFRALLATGADRRQAGVQVVREVTPIIAIAGVTVACGTAGLLVARLGFLRAFGPGLAVAVLIAMLVAVTFVPAALTVFGRAVFWPRSASEHDVRHSHLSPGAVVPERRRSIRLVVAHPVPAALLAMAFVLGCASGLRQIASATS